MERAERVVADDTSEASRVLSLTGSSDDGSHLLLTDESGATFALPVTSRLRAALRSDPHPTGPGGTSGTTGRAGMTETSMDSALRPRDIQARIRAGETAEAVAEAARTSVEKIMPFVAPVLAEREHVAERAQRANLRRPAGDATGASRVLGEAVETHLRSLNIDPDGVVWDAWRREDGRWTLTATYDLAPRLGEAHFSYDARGSFVTVDDDDARWLVGDLVASPLPPARDDLAPVRERRLAPVHEVEADELPLGDDAIELVTEPPVQPAVDAADRTAATEVADLTYDEPLEAFLDDSPASDDPDLRHEAADAAAEEPDPQPEQPPRRPVQKKKGRASVPSWDEIMFGPGDQ